MMCAPPCASRPKPTPCAPLPLPSPPAASAAPPSPPPLTACGATTAPPQGGSTALMKAAYGGNLDCLEHLVSKGANLNVQNNVRRGPATTGRSR